MKNTFKHTGLALAVAACLPMTLSAHRQWLLPSSTVLSGNGKWVTVDAAVSNEIFYFDHNPLRLDNLVITAPDGSVVKAENGSTGKFRSTFDLNLTQNGTYKIALVNNTVMASWEENGETKRWRGTPDKFETEVPKDAKNLQVSRMASRVETFVTANKPTNTALKPTGNGLELSPITHPNDLVTGEDAKFALLLNGKPAANLEVTIIQAGIRYRDKLNEIKVTTDADGKFTAKFENPGMYWLNATYQEGGSPRRQEPSGSGEGSWQAAGQAAGGERPQRGPGGPGRMFSGNRSNYVATLEVMPQ